MAIIYQSRNRLSPIEIAKAIKVSLEHNNIPFEEYTPFQESPSLQDYLMLGAMTYNRDGFNIALSENTLGKAEVKRIFKEFQLEEIRAYPHRAALQTIIPQAKHNSA